MNIDTRPFKNLIKERTGLKLEQSCPETLIYGIRNLMSKRDINYPDDYLKLLINDQKEFLKLLNLLTINETYFFREPVYIKILIDRLLPELFQTLETGKQIRILSAGCSTGEEPYSLAIALMEAFGENMHELFSIKGADIDNDALEKARQGIYRGQAFRSIDLKLKANYFENIDNDKYKIKDNIKNKVQFYNVNLLDKFYPEQIRNMDVIFYRNVSIYFERNIQKKIFNKLAKTLNKKGYLIVSSTETLSHSINILSLIEIDGVFLFYKDDIEKKDTASFYPIPDSNIEKIYKQPLEIKADNDFFKPVVPEIKIENFFPVSSPKDKKKSAQILFDEALSFAKTKSYKKAFDIINKIINEYPDFYKVYTLKAGILINLQQTDKARQICLDLIQTDPLCMEGYLLLGLIAKFENNLDEALKRFREALYISSHTWLAHFYLAEIWKAKGENDQAVREYKIVMKLLEQGRFSEHGLTFFPFSFSEANIVHLCRHSLKNL